MSNYRALNDGRLLLLHTDIHVIPAACVLLRVLQREHTADEVSERCSRSVRMFLHSCLWPVRWRCVQTLFRKQISISTSRTIHRDEARHSPSEKLDLDAWKSVMKSQALPGEDSAEDSGSAPSELDVHRELVETWHQAGKTVPKNITEEQLQELAGLTTKTSKKKYLKFLAIKEAHKMNNNKRKQEKIKAEREVSADVEDEGPRHPKNTFLMKLQDSHMEHSHGWRIAQAMRFDQPLLLDMSYEQHMSRRELENTINQLIESEGWNRRHGEPFHLHFCNLQPDGQYKRELIRRYGEETWERLMITATHRQHVELFPRKDLVYLSADSRTVLHTFDHSKVYIVGAMVDRSIRTGMSLANAKRLKLATARLPLDEYLDWDCGAKNLTLDQMIRILATVKETGNWQKALEFVPRRKHKGFHQSGAEQRQNRRTDAPLQDRRKSWWRDDGK